MDFPGFIKKLKEIGYDGPVSVEYAIEAGNERQKQEIIEGKKYLESIL